MTRINESTFIIIYFSYVFVVRSISLSMCFICDFLFLSLFQSVLRNAFLEFGLPSTSFIFLNELRKLKFDYANEKDSSLYSPLLVFWPEWPIIVLVWRIMLEVLSKLICKLKRT